MEPLPSATGVPPEPTTSPKMLIFALVTILLVYALATFAGWTEAPAGGHSEEHAAAGGPPSISHYWAVMPFTLLLGCIAVLPLAGHTSHWWESNRNKFTVAAGLALLTLLYLMLLHPDASIERAAVTLRHTILNDYIPFIILLFCLYTISGGIRIEGDLPAHALTNSTFMLAGAVLASFIGTTGAAMLLVRPLIETNSERKRVAHTMVFFIFIVCNGGGLLLPLGDPPLFLGYLNAVPFLWTLSLWKSWLFVNGLLIAVYFVWDHFFAYPHETKRDIALDETRVRGLRFLGLWPNVLLLAGVVFAVGLLDPGKPFPGTQWHPGLYLREAVELGLVFLSLTLGSHAVRHANGFNYGAIIEVGALFIGIFICMQPALEILHVRGPSLGLTTPAAFFWASGTLSSVLDNAPTYLVFFKTAQALPTTGAVTVAGVAESLLTGVSLGSVLMGAMTYIGNGPNFMVKAIAESSGIKMPSFFGYLLYSFGVLLPILALNVWLFL